MIFGPKSPTLLPTRSKLDVHILDFEKDDNNFFNPIIGFFLDLDLKPNTIEPYGTGSVV